MISNVSGGVPAFSLKMPSHLADEEEIDFEGFIKILRAGSADSLDNLDQYDARLSNHLSPQAGLDHREIVRF